MSIEELLGAYKPVFNKNDYIAFSWFGEWEVFHTYQEALDCLVDSSWATNICQYSRHTDKFKEID